MLPAALAAGAARLPQGTGGVPEPLAETLGDLRPGSTGSVPSGVVRLGARIGFGADDGVPGREPWCSDGTPAGTWLPGELVPGPGDGEPSCLAWFNDRLCVHGAMPRTLWQSDGTTPGTRQLAGASRRACGFMPPGARLLRQAGRYLPARTGVEPWVLFADVVLGNGFQQPGRAGLLRLPAGARMNVLPRGPEPPAWRPV